MSSTTAHQRLSRRVRVALGGTSYVCAASWDAVIHILIPASVLTGSLWKIAASCNLVASLVVFGLLYGNHVLYAKSLSPTESTPAILDTSKTISKMVTILGDAIVYFGALSFANAVQVSISGSNAPNLYRWVYAVSLLLVATFLLVQLNQYLKRAVAATEKVVLGVAQGLYKIAGQQPAGDSCVLLLFVHSLSHE